MAIWVPGISLEDAKREFDRQCPGSGDALVPGGVFYVNPETDTVSLREPSRAPIDSTCVDVTDRDTAKRITHEEGGEVKTRVVLDVTEEGATIVSVSLYAPLPDGIREFISVPEKSFTLFPSASVEGLGDAIRAAELRYTNAHGERCYKTAGAPLPDDFPNIKLDDEPSGGYGKPMTATEVNELNERWAAGLRAFNERLRTEAAFGYEPWLDGG